MQDKRQTVSIIIPTLDSPRLRDCILSIQDQSHADHISEIIVVGRLKDSYPNSDPTLHFIQVEEKPTAARNRNIGADHATGEWLCFIDSDCIADPDWIEQLLALAPSKTQIIGGAVRIHKNASYWSKCDHFHAFKKFAVELNSRITELSYAVTLNMLVSRSIFLSHGGFDETFHEPAGEDMELSRRMRSAGCTVLFSPTAIVEHHHDRQDLHATWQHLYRFGVAFVKVRDRSPSQLWKVWREIIRIRVIGELASLVWIIARSVLRIFDFRSISFFHYLPGIFILDIAYSGGIIEAIREE